MKKFQRKIGDRLITVTIEKNKEAVGQDRLNGKETKKFFGLTLDGVCSVLGLDHTYDDMFYGSMLRRRELFAKKQFDKENFTKEEGLELANITDFVSDYAANYADGLFYEFVNELSKSGGIEAYRKERLLTEEEKKQRSEDAGILLAKLREKRLQNIAVD